MQDISELLKQAAYDSVLDIECPKCQAMVRMEPDAHEIYCYDCGQVTGKNPLIEQGYI